jgi:predicted nucleotide-binding protein (sugar kinase/HSP70/actin superfamily)
MIRVGIPRALGYFEYETLWRTFFAILGAEVVVSPPTTDATLAALTGHATADLCFPVKVFCGHLLALRKEVDIIFVPALRRMEQDAIHCAKLAGLPDLARVILGDDISILAVDVDLAEGWQGLVRAVLSAAGPFTRHPLRVGEAWDAAWQAHQETLTQKAAARRAAKAAENGSFHIAVLSHPYNLYDSYLNHRLLQRLERLGVHVLTANDVSAKAIEAGIRRLTGEPYWAYAPYLVGAADYFLNQGQADGIVLAVAFGCAPDSGMVEIVTKAAHEAGRPVMTMVLDEHAGEAGYITRIEAFVDILERKGQRAGNESIPGY